MKVTIISRDYIKPSNTSLCTTRISNPTSYASLTSSLLPHTLQESYPNAKCQLYHQNFNNNYILQETLARLKKSLSDALNLYYPYAGGSKTTSMSMTFVPEYSTWKPELIVACPSFSSLGTPSRSMSSSPFLPFARRQKRHRFHLPLFRCDMCVYM